MALNLSYIWRCLILYQCMGEDRSNECYEHSCISISWERGCVNLLFLSFLVAHVDFSISLTCSTWGDWRDIPVIADTYLVHSLMKTFRVSSGLQLFCIGLDTPCRVDLTNKGINLSQPIEEQNLNVSSSSPDVLKMISLLASTGTSNTSSHCQQDNLIFMALSWHPFFSKNIILYVCTFHA